MDSDHEHSEPDEKPLDPEQQKIVAKVRWLMLISGFATLLGIAVVIGVIGYRFFRSNGSAAPAEVTAMLPKGAKVIATAVADDRIAVTIEHGRHGRSPHLRPQDAAADRAAALRHRAVTAAGAACTALACPRDRGYFKSLAGGSLRLAVRTRPSQG